MRQNSFSHLTYCALPLCFTSHTMAQWLSCHLFSIPGQQQHFRPFFDTRFTGHLLDFRRKSDPFSSTGADGSVAVGGGYSLSTDHWGYNYNTYLGYNTGGSAVQNSVNPFHFAQFMQQIHSVFNAVFVIGFFFISRSINHIVLLIDVLYDYTTLWQLGRNWIYHSESQLNWWNVQHSLFMSQICEVGSLWGKDSCDFSCRKRCLINVMVANSSFLFFGQRRHFSNF